MTTVYKNALRIVFLACMVLLSTSTLSFSDVDNDFSQPLKSSMRYEIDGKSVSVTIDETLLNQLDPQSIYNLAKEYTNESIRIVSEDNLSREDLEDSSDVVLFVYAKKKLVRFQVDSGYARKMTLEEARSMIEESANSDSNNVHVYEVGSDGFFASHKSLWFLGLGIVAVSAMLVFRRKNK